ncbi:MAG: nucleotidyltransferase domain-containing protein [Candidatus Edwardsbacteria bacterium]|nr:nucleotidyltransferase domain-containing protein [Candidatus Edwardsbacteria bacterium]
MASVDAEIASKIKEYIERLINAGLDVKEAYLYGSHANGRASPDSDIDIALVTENGRQDEQLLWRLRRAIDVLIEPVAYRRDEFCRESPLVWEILKTGIKLVDDGRWILE